MNFTDDALRILAHRLGVEGASSREELEESVTPLLSMVLRTGTGRPSLVQFVRRHLRLVASEAASGDNVDPAWAAPRLARLLIAQFLRQIGGEQRRTTARETVMA